MPVPTDTQPAITVTLSGVMVICPSEDLSRCEVGLVRGARSHNLLLRIRKNGVNVPGGSLNETTMRSNLALKVENPSSLGVELFNPGSFNRLDTDDINDVRWIIDFEGEEFYNKKLKIKHEELNPIIEFNKGLLYTKQKSEMRVRREGGGKDGVLGKVALVAGIDIDLEQGSTAVLMNGDEEFFRFDPSDGSTFEVIIDRSCARRARQSAAEESDFLHFYQALGPDLKEEEIINLELEDDPNDFGENTPDARCTLGRMSRTDNLDPSS